MPDETTWVTLHNPTLNAWHRVPDNAVVIQDFQDRGWLTPEDSAKAAESDASQLHGQELEDALKAAGLSTSGKVAEKQARLAEYRHESHVHVNPSEPFDPLTQSDTTTPEGTEGEQV